MKKTIISLIIATAVLFAIGFAEIAVLKGGYGKFSDMLWEMLVAADNETIDEVSFQSVIIYWEELRHMSEHFVNQNDLNEINMRLEECRSYVHNEDYEQAYMQLNVLLFFSQYVPQVNLPLLKNIL